MYAPREILDRTLSSPKHFLTAYLVLANTFLISTHHSHAPEERHEFARAYMWMLVLAGMGVCSRGNSHDDLVEDGGHDDARGECDLDDRVLL
jgi:hypothetical protein